MSSRVTCSCGWTRSYQSPTKAEFNARRHVCTAGQKTKARRATRHHRCARCGLQATYQDATAAEARKWFRKHSCRKQEDKMLSAALGEARRALVDRTPKPCLHKVANHEHGTYAAYVLDKCRCEPCSKANSEYESNRQRQIAYGRWNQRVPAGPVREHIEKLRASGMGLKTIAKRAGVSHGALSKLVYGVYAPGPAGRNGKGDLIRPPSRRVLRETAEKIYTIDPEWSGDTLQLADGARDHARSPAALLHLRALVALGYSISDLGRRLGITHRANVTPLFTGERIYQTATVDRIETIYAELSMKVPEPRDRYHQASITRARRMAAARGWLPPLALDDEISADVDAFEDDVDQVAIDRRIAGDKTITLNRAERLEGVRQLHRARHQDQTIGRTLGIHPDQVRRFRLELGLPANPDPKASPVSPDHFTSRGAKRRAQLQQEAS